MSKRVLVYYFAFPHYRLSILNELSSQALGRGVGIDFTAGVASREGIKVLRSKEFPPLDEAPSVSLGPFSWQRGVIGRALRGDYDVVVLGPALSSLTTWFTLVARRALRKRTYLWGQCGRPHDRSLRRYLQEVMNRLATGLLVYGESEGRAARELGTPSAKVHVVRNANGDNGSALASENGVFERAVSRAAQAEDRGVLRILYLGRVISSKRIQVLLHAARELKIRYPQLEVDVVGGGDALEGLKSEFDDSFISFHGAVYGQESIARFVSAATLVCSPYHMGLVAVDALRAGVPVLVPDNPMNASEVEALTLGVNAQYFRAGDPASLAAAAERLLVELRTVSRTEFLRVRREQLGVWAPASVASSILETLI